MKLDGTQTKTAQITRFLEEQIRSGALQRGSVLRSTRLLAADFNVSSQVIRYAFDELEQKGLIHRKPRSGTIVKGMKKFLLVRSERESNVSKNIFQAELFALAREYFFETDVIPVEYIRSADRRKLAGTLKKENYAGALLLCSGYVGNEPELEVLKDLKIPVCIPVAVRDENTVTGFKTFKLDMDSGVLLAGRELVKQKRKNILIIANRQADEEKIVKLWQQNGIRPGSTALIPANLPEQEINAKVRELFQNRQFDAAACHSGVIAVAVYNCCSYLGISIPEDLAVLNFGWAGAGKFLTPKLVEVDYKLKDTARNAVEWLLEGKSAVTAPVLISGESI